MNAQEKTTYLTQEGYDKLLEEKNELEEEKLPKTLEKLKEAIDQGDISENAEYDTAMSEKELFEARIQEIEQTLANVEIIEKQEGGEIRYGSEITVKDEKDREFNYRVVGSGEVDVLNGTISFESPLGRALRGKEEGDEVTVKAPNKKYTITITKVK